MIKHMNAPCDDMNRKVLKHMKIDHTSGVPLYRQIELLIKAEIENGRYGDGHLIPGEVEMAERLGNMVSLIQSNFRGMGTGFVVPGTGFSFQNRGELFSLDPDHPNVYAPGKRPFHTIIPGFVTKEGRPWFSLGVMGGEFQPIGHVQILVNIIDFGMNIQEAGDAIRWLHTNSTEPTGTFSDMLEDGGLVRFESQIDPDIVDALRAKGHTVEI